MLLAQKTSKGRAMVAADDHARPARIRALFVELRHPARDRAVDVAEEGHARSTLALVTLHRQTAHDNLAQGTRLKAVEGLREGTISKHPPQRRVEAVSQDAMAGLEVVLCQAGEGEFFLREALPLVLANRPDELVDPALLQHGHGKTHERMITKPRGRHLQKEDTADSGQEALELGARQGAGSQDLEKELILQNGTGSLQAQSARGFEPALRLSRGEGIL